MFHKYALLLLLATSGLICDDTETVPGAEATEEIPEVATESTHVEITTLVESPVAPSVASQQTKRAPKRRGRRQRGFYNDFRYRDPYNNPHNPNSPYAFRGRPMPPGPGYRTGYNVPQYYDPYNPYYGYPQTYYQPQAGYYPYPYPVQPQPPPPQPPTPPPTERLPDLYYVQSADGQYQYKRVPVQDHYGDTRGRRRPTTRYPVYPQQSYGQQIPQGYYNHPYDPYDRRPPPPPQYYQQYPYNQQQYPPYYQYPKVPGGPRSRLRGGLPPLRSTALPGPLGWRLTSAPTASYDLKLDQQTSEPAEVLTQPVTQQISE